MFFEWIGWVNDSVATQKHTCFAAKWISFKTNRLYVFMIQWFIHNDSNLSHLLANQCNLQKQFQSFQYLTFYITLFSISKCNNNLRFNLATAQSNPYSCFTNYCAGWLLGNFIKLWSLLFFSFFFFFCFLRVFQGVHIM